MRCPLLIVLCCSMAMTFRGQSVLQTTEAAHVARVSSLVALVQSCAERIERCQPGEVGPNETFSLPNGVMTHVSYGWLRSGLGAIASATPDKRPQLAGLLAQRLQTPEMHGAGITEGTARSEADRVLSQVEFAKAKPGWFQRQWDRLLAWMDEHVSLPAPGRGMQAWIRFLFEAALFGTPLLLLVLWFLRQIREDRYTASAPETAAIDRQTDAPRWTEMAKEFAGRGDWREAIHALYSGTIRKGEARGMWAPSPTRTPREYLPLLQPGSPGRAMLREQTLLLELTWFGHRSATEADYKRCEHLSRELTGA